MLNQWAAGKEGEGGMFYRQVRDARMFGKPKSKVGCLSVCLNFTTPTNKPAHPPMFWPFDKCFKLVLIMRVTEEEMEASAGRGWMEHLLRLASIKQPSVQYWPCNADNVWLLTVQLTHFSKYTQHGQIKLGFTDANNKHLSSFSFRNCFVSLPCLLLTREFMATAGWLTDIMRGLHDSYHRFWICVYQSALNSECSQMLPPSAAQSINTRLEPGLLEPAKPFPALSSAVGAIA